eukprot:scpid108067/ scgid18054/ 
MIAQFAHEAHNHHLPNCFGALFCCMTQPSDCGKRMGVWQLCLFQHEDKTQKHTLTQYPIHNSSFLLFKSVCYLIVSSLLFLRTYMYTVQVHVHEFVCRENRPCSKSKSVCFFF